MRATSSFTNIVKILKTLAREFAGQRCRSSAIDTVSSSLSPSISVHKASDMLESDRRWGTYLTIDKCLILVQDADPLFNLVLSEYDFVANFENPEKGSGRAGQWFVVDLVQRSC